MTRVQTIAGHRRNRRIDIIDLLVEHPLASSSKKGDRVDIEGESRPTELHWYDEPTAGCVEWALKRDAGNDWFYDEDW